MRGWHLLRLGVSRVGTWNSRRTAYKAADVALKRHVVRERLEGADEDDLEFNDLQAIEDTVNTAFPASAYDEAGLIPVLQKLVRQVSSGVLFEKEPPVSGASAPSREDEPPRGGTEAKHALDRGTSPVHIEIPKKSSFRGFKPGKRFWTESLNLGKPHEDDDQVLHQRFRNMHEKENLEKEDFTEMMWQSDFKDSMEYLAMMTNRKMLLDENTASVLAWRPGSEKYPDKWDEFKKMAKTAGVGSRAIDGVELSRAARSGDLETAAALVARMKPGELAGLWMIHAYYKAGKMDECIAFFGRLIELSAIRQNLWIFDAFVRATTLSGNQEHAATAVTAFFKFNKDSERRKGCNQLLESLFRGGDSNLVFNTYKLLESDGFQLEPRGIERLITIFGLSGQMERVDEVYLKAATAVQDSISARDALLFAWHMNGHHDFVDREFQALENENLTSLDAIAIKLNQYGRQAKWDSLEDLWAEKFSKKRSPVWIEHYKILILYYRRREDILQLTWKDLKRRRDVFMDEDFFNMLVDFAHQNKMKPFLKTIVARWLKLHKARRSPSAKREKVNKALFKDKRRYQLKWYWKTEGVQDLEKPIPIFSWERGLPRLRELVVRDAWRADTQASKRKRK